MKRRHYIGDKYTYAYRKFWGFIIRILFTSTCVVWSAALRGGSLTLSSCPVGRTSEGGQKRVWTNIISINFVVQKTAEKTPFAKNVLGYDVAYIYNTLWFSLAMKCFDPTKTKHHLEREHYVHRCDHKQCVCEFTCWIFSVLKKNQRMTAGQQVVISFVFQWDLMDVMYDPC